MSRSEDSGEPKNAPGSSSATREAASFAVPRDAAYIGEGIGLHRLLVESVRDYAIFALDASGHVLSWNPGAQRFKGYEAHEIIGKHFSVFYPPADIAGGKPSSMLEEATRNGRVEDEGWRLRKDGSRFWANVVITALRDSAGTLVGFAKVTRDLTERRRSEEALRLSEERFHLLVDSVKDYGIFMLEPTGRIASWNPGAERINGYRADEIIGRHFSTFYPPEDLAWGKPEWELDVASRQGRFEDEGWRLRKDGSRFWANVVITALRNELGDLIGFSKVTRDLTERRAAEQRALEDARRVAQVEGASRAKSEFLAALSHELRTPLNAIGGYTQLMEVGIAGELTETQRDYLQRIRASQQHLLGLISDLLNYSRIEAGQVTYEIVPVPAGEVAAQVVALLEPQAVGKGLRLELEPCSDELRLLGDRLKVEQIMLNLVSNAVKFTPPGGQVQVACTASGREVALTVRDTGPGIPPDKLEAIFEPFVQLGRNLTAAHEGTGLGLAISRDLARAMGGNVTVQTTMGTGSVFRLSLPRE